jgi:hypothetical protein
MKMPMMCIERLQRKTLCSELRPVEVPGRSLASSLRPVDHRPMLGDVMQVMLDILPPAALSLAVLGSIFAVAHIRRF